MTPFNRFEVNGGITLKQCHTFNFLGRLLLTHQHKRETREDWGQNGRLREIETGLTGLLLDGKRRICLQCKVKILQLITQLCIHKPIWIHIGYKFCLKFYITNLLQTWHENIHSIASTHMYLNITLINIEWKSIHSALD